MISTPEQPDLQQALRVVAGNPSPEELAAVIAVLTQAHAEELSHGVRVAAEPKSSWSRNDSILRSQLTPGYLQWQAAFRRGL
ncbi:MAG: hypothetical protein RL670_376 [Actinomycetota bacterium]|jgi:hypothetical protein